MQPSSSIKKTKGKQKIEIKKIENEDVRHVTFSKRRIGVFKKASDLSTLCGTNIALVVHSPAGKPYSFGCPNVEEVINQYLNETMDDVMDVNQGQERHPTLLKELNEKFMEVSKRIDDGKAKKKMLERARKELESERYTMLAMSSNMEELPIFELEGLEEELQKIKMRVDARARELLMNRNPFDFVGPSNQDLVMAPFVGGGATPIGENMGFGFFGHGN